MTDGTSDECPEPVVVAPCTWPRAGSWPHGRLSLVPSEER